jgi:hypothetical protein
MLVLAQRLKWKYRPGHGHRHGQVGLKAPFFQLPRESATKEA